LIKTTGDKDKNLMIRNIFLDRDGTIIQDMHYLSDPAKIVFIPGAVQAMLEMKHSGLDIFVVSNQSGIGRGLFSEEQYHLVQKKIVNMLKDKGVEISDSLFCPHTPQDKCGCRKPNTGMWDYLTGKHTLSPEQSIIIGDKKSDIIFGFNCGFQAAVLTLTGHGEQSLKDLGIRKRPQEWFEPEPRKSFPSAVARDVYSAWNWIRQRFINVN
jgi:D-glycero-D-manno-heptose 1,7-bisphosphate phosphatase